MVLWLGRHGLTVGLILMMIYLINMSLTPLAEEKKKYEIRIKPSKLI